MVVVVEPFGVGGGRARGILRRGAKQIGERIRQVGLRWGRKGPVVMVVAVRAAAVLYGVRLPGSEDRVGVGV
jgi:hypothetical protein